MKKRLLALVEKLLGLEARRVHRERIVKEAAGLILWLGDHAYDEARLRSRNARDRRDRVHAKLWAEVAVQIASETGRTIGSRVEDRYERAPETPADRAQREIRDGLVDVAQGIADLARGCGDTMLAHNTKARVLQIAALGAPSDDLQHIVATLQQAIDALADAPYEHARSLEIRVFPPKAEEAGRALQRLRSQLMRSPL